METYTIVLLIITAIFLFIWVIFFLMNRDLKKENKKLRERNNNLYNKQHIIFEQNTSLAKQLLEIKGDKILSEVNALLGLSELDILTEDKLNELSKQGKLGVLTEQTDGKSSLLSAASKQAQITRLSNSLITMDKEFTAYRTSTDKLVENLTKENKQLQLEINTLRAMNAELINKIPSYKPSTTIKLDKEA